MIHVLARPTGRQVVLWWVVAITILLSLRVFMRAQVFGGATLLETRVTGYMPHEATDLLAKLDASGRTAYKIFQLIDVLFIVAFTGALLQADRWSLARIGSSAGPLKWLLWVPIAYAGVDLAEDLAIFVMLSGPQAQVGGLSGAASVMTVAKWILITTSLLATAVVVTRSWAAQRH